MLSNKSQKTIKTDFHFEYHEIFATAFVAAGCIMCVIAFFVGQIINPSPNCFDINIHNRKLLMTTLFLILSVVLVLKFMKIRTTFSVTDSQLRIRKLPFQSSSIPFDSITSLDVKSDPKKAFVNSILGNFSIVKDIPDYSTLIDLILGKCPRITRTKSHSLPEMLVVNLKARRWANMLLAVGAFVNTLLIFLNVSSYKVWQVIAFDIFAVMGIFYGLVVLPRQLRLFDENFLFMTLFKTRCYPYYMIKEITAQDSTAELISSESLRIELVDGRSATIYDSDSDLTLSEIKTMIDKKISESWAKLEEDEEDLE